VSAKAATLITSNQTKRLNMSRVKQNPTMAARNNSIRIWKWPCVRSKKPQANTKVTA
jgi:hypothetical protein